jgi:hypothetical protein
VTDLTPHALILEHAATPIVDSKTAINKRVQARYDELMLEGKHGHYETMFRVVHEELASQRESIMRELYPEKTGV